MEFLLNRCKDFKCVCMFKDDILYKVVWENDTPTKTIRFDYAMVIIQKDNKSHYSLGDIIKEENNIHLEHFKVVDVVNGLVNTIDDELVNELRKANKYIHSKKEKISYIIIMDEKQNCLDMKELYN